MPVTNIGMEVAVAVAGDSWLLLFVREDKQTREGEKHKQRWDRGEERENYIVHCTQWMTIGGLSHVPGSWGGGREEELELGLIGSVA